jgi:predicted ABC-class ATPase
LLRRSGSSDQVQKTTGFPDEYASSDIRQIALADYLSRHAAAFIRFKHMDQSVSSGNSGWSGPKGGAFNINAPAQEVLPRTSALVLSGGNKSLEMRFTVSLPARGRTILGREAKSILCDNLPELIKNTMMHTSQAEADLLAHIYCVENQSYMRSQLEAKGLVAFVGNGSILPRASGASARKMSGKHVVPFRSPPELEVTMKTKHGFEVDGMGIRKGVTLLTGGGYHGKSTLLEALQLGIYNYVIGDGRTLVVTNPAAVKIRADDGRSVTGTNISAFIKNLPGKRDTDTFTTDDASGSTSMAANISEALELGAKVIMVDEDTSATNLLVRDERMQMLIKNEPITPLVSKVRALYDQHGVSTIIVVGGLGDWLDIADNVIGMDSYVPRLLTKEAKELTKKMPRNVVQDKKYGTISGRSVGFPAAILHDKTPYAKRKDFITIYADRAMQDPSQNEAGIDISGVEQMVEVGQTRTIAHSIRALALAKDSEQ